MPSPIYGWPLPVDSDPPDAPAQLAALAGAIETTIAPTWITTGFVVQAGWSLTIAKGRVLPGDVAELYLQATRTGTTITAPATGKLATIASVVALPAALVPGILAPLSFYAANSAGAGRISGGVVQLAHAMPTSTIATSDVVYIHEHYPLS